VTFDESNGSQVEQVDELCVGKEIPVEKAINKMAIGEVMSQEEDDEDYKIIEESPSATPAAITREFGEKPRVSRIPGNSGPSGGDSQGSQEDENLIQQEAFNPHPRVHQSV
jgi:hypothetical protein